ncbi:hypothetical protein [Sphingopyxis fribergensis]|uniref:hypothetical protein n=1 Tax=Sphingopyxis fribergensis TaxID=1515612 RepID=UPI000B0692DC|nr:hypothetical protein [Sphingopyxis fribergensis]
MPIAEGLSEAGLKTVTVTVDALRERTERPGLAVDDATRFVRSLRTNATLVRWDAGFFLANSKRPIRRPRCGYWFA